MRFLALRTSYCSWFDKRIAGQPQDELFSHSLDLHVHSPCSLLAVTHLPIHRWIHSQDRREAKKVDTILDFCVSSLRRGHANLLCIVPILTDDLRRGSVVLQGQGAYLSPVRTGLAAIATCVFRK